MIHMKKMIPIFTSIFLILTLSVSAFAMGEDLKAKIAKETNGFKDLKLKCIVTYNNTAELKKISSDFAKRYEFKSSTIMFKSPDKMKMEGKLGIIKGKIVFNGDKKALIIPSVGINDKDDLKKDPHKRQSELDLGIFTDSLWDYYVIKSVDRESIAGNDQYKIVFVRSNAKSKNLVCWVDSDTFKLRKIEKYLDDGSLKSRTVYADHKRVGDCIWIPMAIHIYNANGKLAAATKYQDVKINTGIADSEFKL